MTKLHLLNQYVTERLMEAVREILDVVGDMMSEYQEETARAQRENESLRRRLREVVFVAEAPWTEGPPAATPVPPVQEVTGTDWDSQQTQEMDTPPSGGKREPRDEPSAPGGAAAEQEAQTPGLKKLALEIALSVVSPSSSVSAELSAIHLADSVISGPRAPAPGEPVKTEPADADLKSERLSELPHANEQLRRDAARASCGTSSSAACETSSTEVDVEERCRAREADEACEDGCFLSCMQEKQHCCLQCGKFFSQRFNLKTHLQIHSGERPYSCSWCGKSFTQSADLRRHQRIHTGEKPHRCTWCQKGFTQVGNLKRHLRIHTGERPYCCTLCGKSFNDGDTLKKHRRIHTGERPYYCPHCARTFTAASSLQNHLRHHTRAGAEPL